MVYLVRGGINGLSSKRWYQWSNKYSKLSLLSLCSYFYLFIIGLLLAHLLKLIYNVNTELQIL